MIPFLARRTAALVAAVLLASFVVFLIPYVTPGDPVRKIIRSRVAGDVIDDSAVEPLSLQLGLNDPLWAQYLRWLGRLGSGDMGLSYTSRTPVAEQVLPALWVTLSLVVLALGIAAVISVGLGVTAALREGRAADKADHGGHPGVHRDSRVLAGADASPGLRAAAVPAALGRMGRAALCDPSRGRPRPAAHELLHVGRA